MNPNAPPSKVAPRVRRRPNDVGRPPPPPQQQQPMLSSNNNNNNSSDQLQNLANSSSVAPAHLSSNPGGGSGGGPPGHSSAPTNLPPSQHGSNAHLPGLAHATGSALSGENANTKHNKDASGGGGDMASGLNSECASPSSSHQYVPPPPLSGGGGNAEGGGGGRRMPPSGDFPSTASLGGMSNHSPSSVVSAQPSALHNNAGLSVSGGGEDNSSNHTLLQQAFSEAVKSVSMVVGYEAQHRRPFAPITFHRHRDSLDDCPLIVTNKTSNRTSAAKHSSTSKTSVSSSLLQQGASYTQSLLEGNFILNSKDHNLLLPSQTHILKLLMDETKRRREDVDLGYVIQHLHDIINRCQSELLDEVSKVNTHSSSAGAGGGGVGTTANNIINPNNTINTTASPVSAGGTDLGVNSSEAGGGGAAQGSSPVTSQNLYTTSSIGNNTTNINNNNKVVEVEQQQQQDHETAILHARTRLALMIDSIVFGSESSRHLLIGPHKEVTSPPILLEYSEASSQHSSNNINSVQMAGGSLIPLFRQLLPLWAPSESLAAMDSWLLLCPDSNRLNTEWASVKEEHRVKNTVVPPQPPQPPLTQNTTTKDAASQPTTTSTSTDAVSPSPSRQHHTSSSNVSSLKPLLAKNASKAMLIAILPTTRQAIFQVVEECLAALTTVRGMPPPIVANGTRGHLSTSTGDCFVLGVTEVFVEVVDSSTSVAHTLAIAAQDYCGYLEHQQQLQKIADSSADAAAAAATAAAAAAEGASNTNTTVNDATTATTGVSTSVLPTPSGPSSKLPLPVAATARPAQRARPTAGKRPSSQPTAAAPAPDTSGGKASKHPPAPQSSVDEVGRSSTNTAPFTPAVEGDTNAHTFSSTMNSTGRSGGATSSTTNDRSRPQAPSTEVRYQPGSGWICKALVHIPVPLSESLHIAESAFSKIDPYNGDNTCSGKSPLEYFTSLLSKCVVHRGDDAVARKGGHENATTTSPSSSPPPQTLTPQDLGRLQNCFSLSGIQECTGGLMPAVSGASSPLTSIMPGLLQQDNSSTAVPTNIHPLGPLFSTSSMQDCTSPFSSGTFNSLRSSRVNHNLTQMTAPRGGFNSSGSISNSVPNAQADSTSTPHMMQAPIPPKKSGRSVSVYTSNSRLLVGALEAFGRCVTGIGGGLLTTRLVETTTDEKSNIRASGATSSLSQNPLGSTTPGGKGGMSRVNSSVSLSSSGGGGGALLGATTGGGGSGGGGGAVGGGISSGASQLAPPTCMTLEDGHGGKVVLSIQPALRTGGGTLSLSTMNQTVTAMSMLEPPVSTPGISSLILLSPRNNANNANNNTSGGGGANSQHHQQHTLVLGVHTPHHHSGGTSSTSHHVPSTSHHHNKSGGGGRLLGPALPYTYESCPVLSVASAAAGAFMVGGGGGATVSSSSTAASLSVSWDLFHGTPLIATLIKTKSCARVLTSKDYAVDAYGVTHIELTFGGSYISRSDMHMVTNYVENRVFFVGEEFKVDGLTFMVSDMKRPKDTDALEMFKQREDVFKSTICPNRDMVACLINAWGLNASTDQIGVRHFSDELWSSSDSDGDNGEVNAGTDAHNETAHPNDDITNHHYSDTDDANKFYHSDDENGDQKTIGSSSRSNVPNRITRSEKKRAKALLESIDGGYIKSQDLVCPKLYAHLMERANARKLRRANSIDNDRSDGRSDGRSELATPGIQESSQQMWSDRGSAADGSPATLSASRRQHSTLELDSPRSTGRETVHTQHGGTLTLVAPPAASVPVTRQTVNVAHIRDQLRRSFLPTARLSKLQAPVAADAPHLSPSLFKSVKCGLVSPNTIVCYTSTTFVENVLIELSEEMWSPTVDGRTNLDWALNCFLREHVARLKAASSAPKVRLVFFGTPKSAGILNGNATEPNKNNRSASGSIPPTSYTQPGSPNPAAASNLKASGNKSVGVFFTVWFSTSVAPDYEDDPTFYLNYQDKKKMSVSRDGDSDFSNSDDDVNTTTTTTSTTTNNNASSSGAASKRGSVTSKRPMKRKGSFATPDPTTTGGTGNVSSSGSGTNNSSSSGGVNGGGSSHANWRSPDDILDSIPDVANEVCRRVLYKLRQLKDSQASHRRHNHNHNQSSGATAVSSPFQTPLSVQRKSSSSQNTLHQTSGDLSADDPRSPGVESSSVFPATPVNPNKPTFQIHHHNSGGTTGDAGEATGASVDGSFFTCAKEAHVLEAINLCLNGYDSHHLDRDMTHTGQTITVVSAGKGLYSVRRRLALMTATRFLDIGVQSCRFVCMGRPPLHLTPLLEYDGSDLRQVNTQAEQFISIPSTPSSHAKRRHSKEFDTKDFDGGVSVKSAGGVSSTKMESSSLRALAAPFKDRRHYYEQPQWAISLFYHPTLYPSTLEASSVVEEHNATSGGGVGREVRELGLHSNGLTSLRKFIVTSPLVQKPKHARPPPSSPLNKTATNSNRTAQSSSSTAIHPVDAPGHGFSLFTKSLWDAQLNMSRAQVSILTQLFNAQASFDSNPFRKGGILNQTNSFNHNQSQQGDLGMRLFATYTASTPVQPHPRPHSKRSAPRSLAGLAPEDLMQQYQMTTPTANIGTHSRQFPTPVARGQSSQRQSLAAKSNSTSQDHAAFYRQLQAGAATYTLITTQRLKQFRDAARISLRVGLQLSVNESRKCMSRCLAAQFEQTHGVSPRRLSHASVSAAMGLHHHPLTVGVRYCKRTQARVRVHSRVDVSGAVNVPSVLSTFSSVAYVEGCDLPHVNDTTAIAQNQLSPTQSTPFQQGTPEPRAHPVTTSGSARFSTDSTTTPADNLSAHFQPVPELIPPNHVHRYTSLELLKNAVGTTVSPPTSLLATTSDMNNLTRNVSFSWRGGGGGIGQLLERGGGGLHTSSVYNVSVMESGTSYHRSIVMSHAVTDSTVKVTGFPHSGRVIAMLTALLNGRSSIPGGRIIQLPAAPPTIPTFSDPLSDRGGGLFSALTSPFSPANSVPKVVVTPLASTPCISTPSNDSSSRHARLTSSSAILKDVLIIEVEVVAEWKHVHYNDCRRPTSWDQSRALLNFTQTSAPTNTDELFGPPSSTMEPGSTNNRTASQEAPTPIFPSLASTAVGPGDAVLDPASLAALVLGTVPTSASSQPTFGRSHHLTTKMPQMLGYTPPYCTTSKNASAAVLGCNSAFTYSGGSQRAASTEPTPIFDAFDDEDVPTAALLRYNNNTNNRSPHFTAAAKSTTSPSLLSFSPIGSALKEHDIIGCDYGLHHRYSTQQQQHHQHQRRSGAGATKGGVGGSSTAGDSLVNTPSRKAADEDSEEDDDSKSSSSESVNDAPMCMCLELTLKVSVLHRPYRSPGEDMRPPQSTMASGSATQYFDSSTNEIHGFHDTNSSQYQSQQQHHRSPTRPDHHPTVALPQTSAFGIPDLAATSHPCGLPTDAAPPPKPPGCEVLCEVEWKPDVLNDAALWRRLLSSFNSNLVGGRDAAVAAEEEASSTDTERAGGPYVKELELAIAHSDIAGLNVMKADWSKGFRMRAPQTEVVESAQGITIPSTSLISHLPDLFPLPHTLTSCSGDGREKSMNSSPFRSVDRYGSALSPKSAAAGAAASLLNQATVPEELRPKNDSIWGKVMAAVGSVGNNGNNNVPKAASTTTNGPDGSSATHEPTEAVLAAVPPSDGASTVSGSLFQQHCPTADLAGGGSPMLEEMRSRPQLFADTASLNATQTPTREYFNNNNNKNHDDSGGSSKNDDGGNNSHTRSVKLELPSHELLPGGQSIRLYANPNLHGYRALLPPEQVRFLVDEDLLDIKVYSSVAYHPDPATEPPTAEASINQPPAEGEVNPTSPQLLSTTFADSKRAELRPSWEAEDAPIDVIVDDVVTTTESKTPAQPPQNSVPPVTHTSPTAELLEAAQRPVTVILANPKSAFVASVRPKLSTLFPFQPIQPYTYADPDHNNNDDALHRSQSDVVAQDTGVAYRVAGVLRQLAHMSRVRAKLMRYRRDGCSGPGGGSSARGGESSVSSYLSRGNIDGVFATYLKTAAASANFDNPLLLLYTTALAKRVDIELKATEAICRSERRKMRVLSYVTHKLVKQDRRDARTATRQAHSAKKDARLLSKLSSKNITVVPESSASASPSPAPSSQRTSPPLFTMGGTPPTNNNDNKGEDEDRQPHPTDREMHEHVDESATTINSRPFDDAFTSERFKASPQQLGGSKSSDPSVSASYQQREDPLGGLIGIHGGGSHITLGSSSELSQQLQSNGSSGQHIVFTNSDMVQPSATADSGAAGGGDARVLSSNSPVHNAKVERTWKRHLANVEKYNQGRNELLRLMYLSMLSTGCIFYLRWGYSHPRQIAVRGDVTVPTYKAVLTHSQTVDGIHLSKQFQKYPFTFHNHTFAEIQKLCGLLWDPFARCALMPVFQFNPLETSVLTEKALTIRNGSDGDFGERNSDIHRCLNRLDHIFSSILGSSFLQGSSYYYNSGAGSVSAAASQRGLPPVLLMSEPGAGSGSPHSSTSPLKKSGSQHRVTRLQSLDQNEQVLAGSLGSRVGFATFERVEDHSEFVDHHAESINNWSSMSCSMNAASNSRTKNSLAPTRPPFPLDLAVLFSPGSLRLLDTYYQDVQQPEKGGSSSTSLPGDAVDQINSGSDPSIMFTHKCHCISVDSLVREYTRVEALQHWYYTAVKRRCSGVSTAASFAADLRKRRREVLDKLEIFVDVEWKKLQVIRKQQHDASQQAAESTESTTTRRPNDSSASPSQSASSQPLPPLPYTPSTNSLDSNTNAASTASLPLSSECSKVKITTEEAFRELIAESILDEEWWFVAPLLSSTRPSNASNQPPPTNATPSDIDSLSGRHQVIQSIRTGSLCLTPEEHELLLLDVDDTIVAAIDEDAQGAVRLISSHSHDVISRLQVLVREAVLQRLHRGFQVVSIRQDGLEAVLTLNHQVHHISLEIRSVDTSCGNAECGGTAIERLCAEVIGPEGIDLLHSARIGGSTPQPQGSSINSGPLYRPQKHSLFLVVRKKFHRDVYETPAEQRVCASFHIHNTHTGGFEKQHTQFVSSVGGAGSVLHPLLASTFSLSEHQWYVVDHAIVNDTERPFETKLMFLGGCAADVARSIMMQPDIHGSPTTPHQKFAPQIVVPTKSGNGGEECQVVLPKSVPQSALDILNDIYSTRGKSILAANFSSNSSPTPSPLSGGARSNSLTSASFPGIGANISLNTSEEPSASASAVAAAAAVLPAHNQQDIIIQNAVRMLVGAASESVQRKEQTSQKSQSSSKHTITSSVLQHRTIRFALIPKNPSWLRGSNRRAKARSLYEHVKTVSREVLGRCGALDGIGAPLPQDVHANITFNAQVVDVLLAYVQQLCSDAPATQAAEGHIIPEGPCRQRSCQPPQQQLDTPFHDSTNAIPNTTKEEDFPSYLASRLLLPREFIHRSFPCGPNQNVVSPTTPNSIASSPLLSSSDQPAAARFRSHVSYSTFDSFIRSKFSKRFIPEYSQLDEHTCAHGLWRDDSNTEISTVNSDELLPLHLDTLKSLKEATQQVRSDVGAPSWLSLDVSNLSGSFPNQHHGGFGVGGANVNHNHLGESMSVSASTLAGDMDMGTYGTTTAAGEANENSASTLTAGEVSPDKRRRPSISISRKSFHVDSTHTVGGTVVPPSTGALGGSLNSAMAPPSGGEPTEINNLSSHSTSFPSSQPPQQSSSVVSSLNFDLLVSRQASLADPRQVEIAVAMGLAARLLRDVATASGIQKRAASRGRRGSEAAQLKQRDGSSINLKALSLAATPPLSSSTPPHQSIAHLIAVFDAIRLLARDRDAEPQRHEVPTEQRLTRITMLQDNAFAFSEHVVDAYSGLRCFNVLPRRTRYMSASIHLTPQFNPRCFFMLEVRWLLCSASLIGEWVRALVSFAHRDGLETIPVPASLNGAITGDLTNAGAGVGDRGGCENSMGGPLTESTSVAMGALNNATPSSGAFQQTGPTCQQHASSAELSNGGASGKGGGNEVGDLAVYCTLAYHPPTQLHFRVMIQVLCCEAVLVSESERLGLVQPSSCGDDDAPYFMSGSRVSTRRATLSSLTVSMQTSPLGLPPSHGGSFASQSSRRRSSVSPTAAAASRAAAAMAAQDQHFSQFAQASSPLVPQSTTRVISNGDMNSITSPDVIVSGSSSCQAVPNVSSSSVSATGSTAAVPARTRQHLQESALNQALKRVRRVLKSRHRLHHRYRPSIAVVDRPCRLLHTSGVFIIGIDMWRSPLSSASHSSSSAAATLPPHQEPFLMHMGASSGGVGTGVGNINAANSGEGIGAAAPPAAHLAPIPSQGSGVSNCRLVWSPNPLLATPPERVSEERHHWDEAIITTDIVVSVLVSILEGVFNRE